MTDIFEEEHGTLDKYRGDAIIAFLGAPVPLESHVKNACLVAIKMLDVLAELKTRWRKENLWNSRIYQMHMRIGINTLEIVIGNMGSTNRMNYTMMADNVNLAARLEEAAKQYRVFIQVSDVTVAIVKEDFEWRKRDS